MRRSKFVRGLKVGNLIQYFAGDGAEKLLLIVGFEGRFLRCAFPGTSDKPTLVLIDSPRANCRARPRYAASMTFVSKEPQTISPRTSYQWASNSTLTSGSLTAVYPAPTVTYSGYAWVGPAWINQGTATGATTTTTTYTGVNNSPMLSSGSLSDYSFDMVYVLKLGWWKKIK